MLKPSRLEPVKVEDLALTSERHVQVRWRLQPFGDLPPGNPVAWPEVEDPLVLAPGLTPGRKILRTWPPEADELRLDNRQVTERREFVAGPSAPPRSTLTLHGLYRGQRITVAVPVTFQPNPDIVAYHYSELPLAAIAARRARRTWSKG